MACAADIFQWVVVVLLAFTSAALVLSNFDTPLKFRVFSVSSGSMEPAVHTGSMVFVVPQDNYVENDVITFRSRTDPKKTTTHRITQVSQDLDLGFTSYSTKGDANEDPDAGITYKEQVIGKVVFSLPFLGYLVAFAKTQLGFTFLIVMPATILIYGEVNNIRKELSAAFKDKKAKKKDTKEKQEEVKVEPEKKEGPVKKVATKTTKKKTTRKKSTKKKEEK